MKVAFTFGKHRPLGFSSKSRRGKENLFGWRSLSLWGSTTRPGFWQNHVGARKTCLGGGRFRLGEAPPVRVFVKITPGREKPVWVELAFALGKHRPSGFLTKSRQGKERNFARVWHESRESIFPIFFKENFDTMEEQDIANENFQRAKELLDAGRSIENAAREIGIKSKSSFTIFFKTHAGITPNEYISRQASERPFCFCETPLGLIRIEENNYGITSLLFIDDKAQNISARGKGIYLASAKAQVSEYFFKRRKTFDIPLSLAESEFQKKVWSALQSIPYGETRSYKQIAEIVGNENAARAVGMANNRNPIIPCHRVIGGDGKLVGYGGGIERKEYLLKMESE